MDDFLFDYVRKCVLKHSAQYVSLLGKATSASVNVFSRH